MIARRFNDADHARAEDEPDALDLVAAAATTDIRLYDATDLPWITIVIDHVMSCLGQPWRILRERLEHAPIRGARVAAILAAMRRLMDGRAQRTKIARKIRQSVLGHPALDDASRAERLTKAGEELGIDPSEIEGLLWIDLADERPVALPDGRPEEQRLAAYANVDRIQRALRRAKHVRIHAWGNAHALIRTAARYGLLARISSSALVEEELVTRDGRDIRDGSGTRDGRDARDTDGHTIIDIVGPLSLFHQTHVYGRALGSVVPLLASLDRFVLEIDADFGYGLASLRVASPALLPPTAAERGKPSVAAKLSSALERVRNVVIERDPAPIAHERERLFPDLAIEVVGPLPRVARAGSEGNNDRDDRDDRGDRDDRDDVHRPRETRDGEDDGPEDDRDLAPDLAVLLAAHMNDAADRIASNTTSRASNLDREIVATLPPRERPDRSRCWFIEVVGFATTEYLMAKLSRYEAAGIERVLLVVDDTRDDTIAEMKRVVAYNRRTIVADVLAIIEESTRPCVLR